jgi:hypothetical protein
MYPKLVEPDYVYVPDSASEDALPLPDPTPTEAPFVKPSSIGAVRGLPLPSTPLEIALQYCQV